MPAGLFVTGTDTGVGKTVVSAALMCLYRRRAPVCYWKPIQTGIERDNDTAAVTGLARCGAGEVLDVGIRLRRPISPHLAAEAAHTTIGLDALDHAGNAFRRPEANERFWIVEGAGGVLVPLNDEQMIADLIVRLGLPAIVVARTSIGTINHTLLTLDALGRRRIACAAVVMSGSPDAGARRTIERHGGVPVVDVPVFDPLAYATIVSWAIREGASWPI